MVEKLLSNYKFETMLVLGLELIKWPRTQMYVRKIYCCPNFMSDDSSHNYKVIENMGTAKKIDYTTGDTLGRFSSSSR